MATQNCWDIRSECKCRDMSPKESMCPSHRSGKSCWEFDWLVFYNKLPASEQEFWSTEFEKCTECNVFSLFDHEMRLNVLMLKENYPHD